MDVAYAGDSDFSVSVAGFTGGLNQLQVSLKMAFFCFLVFNSSAPFHHEMLIFCCFFVVTSLDCKVSSAKVFSVREAWAVLIPHS